MNMTQELLQSYARLIVRSGANVRPGQTVLLNIAVDQAPFAAMLTEECYQAGAKKVNIDWQCDAVSRLHFQYAETEVLGRVLPWEEAKAKQIVEDGYFHADPHLGNIRVRNGKIVWLDLGMIGRMSTHDRNALRKAMLALADHDAYEMKSAVLALGLPKGRVDHTRLYEDIDVLINKYGDLDFKSLQMGELTHQIMNVLRTHQIGIGPGLSMFARGVLTIEGVMRRCCPDVSFVEIFAVSLQMNFRKNFNWRAELDKFKRDGYVILKKTMQLPEQISDILKMTMSGQTKVNLDITGSEEPIRRIDTMVNKLILGLISSALLLASSVICTTQMTPRIMEMPLVGLLGYLAALVLCGRLLVDIIRGK